MTDRDRRRVAAWLLLCAALIFAIVLVGGITRLTRSGLSIVEWQPLIGVLPPLSHADWEALFAKYRETPEFRLVNFAITLEGFKGIFWLEYIHRLWGRLIGFAFLLPFLWFWVRGRLPKGYWPTLLGLFVLGGLQGLVGWVMVASGLVDRPSVSHYRLAAHLGLAIVIYAGSALMVYLMTALHWWEPAYRVGFAGWMTPRFDPRLPSLLFALCFVGLWSLLAYAMWRRGWRVRL